MKINISFHATVGARGTWRHSALGAVLACREGFVVFLVTLSRGNCSFPKDVCRCPFEGYFIIKFLLRTRHDQAEGYRTVQVESEWLDETRVSDRTN